MNTLYFGDNKDILRQHIGNDSISLIYLDPPFNSRRDYSLLFKTPKGHVSDAQLMAFDDAWEWGTHAEEEYQELIRQPNTDVAEMMVSFRRFLGENAMMAYITSMSLRLLELHRVLKPTGTLWLHCDPTASHYLKIVLDRIFSPANFTNEIIWKRINAKGNVRRKFGAIHDTLLVYAKQQGKQTWNQLYRPLDPTYVKTMYRYVEEGTGRRYRLGDLTAPMQRASKEQIYEWKEKRPQSTRCWVYAKERMQELEDSGRIIYSKTGYPQFKRYLDEQPGEKLPDIWDDINPVSGNEFLRYPTQKPLALLERIISASANPGDIVLDPFCGCGTAVHAAQKLNREWIGIDITNLAISLIEKRLREAFPKEKDFFVVEGTPKDLDGARDLALRDKYQFQWWACSLVNAQPYQGKKKGSDGGIDGLIFFQDEPKESRKIVVSVKGGENVGVTMVKDLIATVARDNASIGLFVTLAEPTKPMVTEAASAGFYDSPLGMSFPKIQILTIDGLLHKRKQALFPDLARGGLTFKRAQPEQPASKQEVLL